MAQTKGSRHIFSFYSPEVISTVWVEGATISVRNDELVHRLAKVVKVQEGDICVLFDRYVHATVTIIQVTKKDIKILVDELRNNVTIQPKISFLLPLLKKEALEEAVYSLCETGVSEIQLVAIQKSRTSSAVTPKELDRLRGILIAAAEQSKNYSFPVLQDPKNIQDAVGSIPSGVDKIVFDVSGKSFFDIYKKTAGKSVVLSVGPEGGLTGEELDFLRNHGFESCALTKTTLRAVQAVAVSSALFRLA
ncbi:MAG: RsmE family RNA methyltransferase [Candidatus Dependentiae bacterium]|nr:RsmE family RNA methyltransferase [Candidatus Dependentiae bacterium]